MRHPVLEYLAWAQRHYGQIRFDLASSDAPTPSLEELGCAGLPPTLEGESLPGPPTLREAVGLAYKTSPDRVFCGLGAAGVAGCVFRSMLNPGDEVLCEQPGYEPLWQVPAGLGAELRFFPRDPKQRARIDLDSVAAMLSARTRLIVVTNLHNPSGCSIDRGTLARLGELCEAVGGHVLVDEVYLDHLGPETPPAASLGDPFISINSVTKVLGLGDLRVGWALASPVLVEAFYRALTHDTVHIPAPSVSLALAALRKRDHLIRKARQGLGEAKQLLSDWAKARRDVTFYPPDAGLVGWLALVSPTLTGRAVAEHAIQHHQTVVAPGDFFGDKSGIRIRFGTERDLLIGGLEALGKTLDELA